MSERSTEQIRELLDSLYRVDSGRILATLIRLLGDFDLAEEAMHEAIATALYNRLARIQPSPVVELNRAAAMAMRDGPEVGLAHIDAVLAHGELADYYLAHAARADMCRRLGRIVEARSSYEKALALTQQEPERKFLEERLRQLK
jgi:predicted RNA polymerase sigma factor